MQVGALQQHGASPSAIAAALGISRRQVHRVIRDLAMEDPPLTPVPPLSALLLAQVQRYVTGRLDVPAVIAATRRDARIDRAFTAGEATTVIARRERCSTRMVRRERARWRERPDSAGEGRRTMGDPPTAMTVSAWRAAHGEEEQTRTGKCC